MSNARENVNLLTSTDWDIAALRLANWGAGAVPSQVVLKTNYVAGDGGEAGARASTRRGRVITAYLTHAAAFLFGFLVCALMVLGRPEQE